ncbi:molybdenum-pterin binding domain-containing protein [Peptoniphilus asaccharolyticus DSM 20463]|uniref:Molybdenum-pterin binding domain-containing protein n=1 Tax=Peptoniphilus asaccharolyticus DSM 20463 TaxID=573058 RepID=A0A1W1UVJ7_PEPAS|nr:TOBE domain-containing protein [Peptoniphilus asaccharolyticus]MBL7575246.1 TOBE domain-containing protein [Peptoniphilus asaccharolyticus]SMB85056.1 molybdenum-pterin binding domain-containing protein [Peptoniphilus asaccharolyticus DSM 20463]
MKISARNVFKGKVVAIEKGAVNGIVKIDLGNDVIITSSITNSAIEELGLEVGKEANAIVKASNVMVGVE